MTVTNPFSQIKDALRGYLGRHWDAMDPINPAKVRVANRWMHKGLKQYFQAADLPAVDIRAAEGVDSKPFATSDTGLFARNFELGIATDDRSQEDPSLDQVEWELIRVAAQAAIERLGLPNLVTKVETVNTRQTREDPSESRGRGTWTGVVTIAVGFQVPRAAILPG